MIKLFEIRNMWYPIIKRIADRNNIDSDLKLEVSYIDDSILLNGKIFFRRYEIEDYIHQMDGEFEWRMINIFRPIEPMSEDPCDYIWRTRDGMIECQ